MIFVRS